MRSLVARFQGWWAAVHEENAEAIEQTPVAWTRWAILLASTLALYTEMVMIRWHATSAHVFAIFKNVSLLSCFLGLGIGFALSSRKRAISMAAFVPVLALQVLLFALIASTIGGERVNPVAEQLVMGLQGHKWSWWHMIGGNLFLAGIFVLNANMFVPLGYVSGRLMNRLPTLQAYSLNLIGSLAGIGLFFLISLVWSPPAVWIGLAVLLAVPFLWGHTRITMVSVGSMALVLLTLGAMGKPDERSYYSPYQVIALRLPKPWEPEATCTIKVNHAFFQDIIDCSPPVVARSQAHAEAAGYYALPYKLRPDAGDVLVVGAGAGNDVAAALRHGATSVTAVEIDPAIQYLGRRLHPERPYQDPRTIPVLNDARSYLRQTDQRYDTIIYGLLDSHTNLGAMTNVRLDSFVYTVEGFREAMACLKPDGLVVCSYLVMDQSQADKLYAMLHQAYPEHEPRVFAAPRGLVFVNGPGLKQLPAKLANIPEVTRTYREKTANAEVATDDWPYFYMQKRTYPITYAVMILFLLGVSAWMVRRRLGSVQLTTARQGVYFFLGAGFMLIETKVITELGLVHGNTWSVIAVAITGILIMGYLANLCIGRWGALPRVPAFVLLGVALAAGLLTTRLAMAGYVLPMNKLLLPVVLTAPLFFAGLIFSGELTRGGGIGDAIAANLFGAMLGGFLEYNSMYWGLTSLYPLGMTLYGLALVCAVVDQRQATSTPAADGAATEAPRSEAA
ncbi:MAG: hypothetical protein JNM56_34505 [Planctomycetia bacterium]|nr:hypothetical protein [Planctomycetia bacterium]